MDLSLVILFIINFIQHLILEVNGDCTWPTEFNSNQWHDSSRGILTFGTKSMQGWTFQPTSTLTVNSWDCVSVSTYSTDGRILLITSQPFSLFSTNYYAYLCITVTKITESSYSYYINHEIQHNVNFERAFIYPANNLTDHNTICSNSGASGGEYQMLVKEGSEFAAKVHCPWHFLGQYGYTHTTSDAVTTCDQSSSKISTCTNTQHMKFDYIACATKVAYSVSDTLWCINNVVEGETNYVMVFNGNDASSLIDNQSIYRFTCIAVSGDVTKASVSPRYCQKDQTPALFPRTSSGQTIGALLSFAPASLTCRK
ncbi:uncharacterized protein LOC132741821 [Ruditapes philippinarum]|uniref:uncharacterized protein LOC132741821 n=1 Tax=Ruditapes philippinarum TaxID=129788 RepID=UPI00295B9FE1|nr:uncharacterized protein LOC132741821 [Ruditapes philippinarum]